MQDREANSRGAVSPENWLEQHGNFLFSYALSRLRDANAAEEAVQETFLAGLKAAAQYSGKGEERAWLLGILKRKIVDSVRRRNRQAAIGSESGETWLDSIFDVKGHWRSDPRFLATQPSDSLERQEVWAAFRECLGKLPTRQADVFVFRELDDWDSEKICKELEISPSNLWVLLHRARLQLAKCLQGRLHIERSR
jgi:RNA polymerase sigma-70 factor (ECF subfamily)